MIEIIITHAVLKLYSHLFTRLITWLICLKYCLKAGLSDRYIKRSRIIALMHHMHQQYLM